MKFNKFALSELATIKYGKNQKKVLSEGGNIPIYGTGGLMGYATTALYDKPSVLIGRKGTIGKVKYVEHPFWTVDTLFYTIVNTDIVLPKYLYYVMSLMDLNNYNEGTTIPSLRTETLNRLEFDIPSLVEQETILSCLNPIDEKIALNNAINNNLEQQAQAIFKSWFIDFEPFSNRKPSDWSLSTLGNVSIMGAGGDKPQNVSPIKTDLYEYPIYSNGLSNEGLYGFTDKPKISEESVTVSARGTIGFVCLRHIPYVPIVRLVTLIPKTEIVSAKYLYLWLKQLHITGTGTTQQQLTVPDFQKTEILVPSQKIVTLFTATVEPIFEKIWANQNENEKLSSLRDTLLPKLMSGELDVSDIDL
jgi:putative restriction modification system DNA specificity subunit